MSNEKKGNELPETVTKLVQGGSAFEIKVQSINPSLMEAQGRAMVQHNGCISAPGGPSC